MNKARFATASHRPIVSTVESSAGQASEIDLLSVLRTLWRGKWLVLGVTACFAALAAGYISWLAVPHFTATAVVSLQNRAQQVVDIESVLSGVGTDQASVNTEVEVLRSRGLIDRLVDQLDLHSDPEFNVFLRPESPWAPRALLSFVLGTAEPPPMPSDRVVRDKVVEQVLGALTVSNIRQSYAFQIAARTKEPEKSALIADTLADLYIRDQTEVRIAATETAAEWLASRVSQLKAELIEAQRAVQQFNANIDLISAERLEAMNRQLKDLRERQAGMMARHQQLLDRVAELQAARESGDFGVMAEIAGTPQLADLWQDISSGADVDEQVFETQFDRILARARFEADQNASQLETMDSSIAKLEQQVTAQSAEALKLEQLRQEAEASQFIYEHFLGRLKETSVQRGMQQPDARVLSHAMLPIAPSSPKPMLILPLSVILGLFAGSALVMLREMRSNAFRTAEDLESHTGTTVIGQIPRGPSGQRKRILESIATKSDSALGEAVRNLRTSILLSSLDREPKVIMLTSSVPGEGKTTLSLSLAHNIAKMGKKVLVIEGDIRRRTFSEIFKVKQQLGLQTAVLEKTPVEEIAYHDERLQVDILFGESAKVNAADFFSSERFSDFLGKVRDSYDFVVIDTPPVLLVPDARVIGQSSDVNLYIVRWDSTSRRQVTEGIQALASVNAPVTGLVLSQVDPKGMKKYGFSGTYGQGYASYSKRYYK